MELMAAKSDGRYLGPEGRQGVNWKWRGDEFRTLTTQKGLLLCGGGMRGFYIIGGPVAPPTWGTGTRREDSCIHQGRLGLGDSVQLVISGPLWPTGQNDQSHSPAPCQPPSQGLLLSLGSGLGSFTGGKVDGPRRQKAAPRWLSFPQRRACWAVTAPRAELAQPPAPASRAGQTVPGRCAVVCGHRVCSRRLPPCLPSGSRRQP